MMRILHTGDWHFGRTLEGRSRFAEQEQFMDELVDIVKDQQIDLILLAGDVYDSVNPPAAAERLFYEGLSRLADGGERYIRVIAGNHDHPERLAASAPLVSKQNIRLLGLPVHDTETFVIPRTGEEAILYSLPYPSESRLQEVLSDNLEEEVLRSAYSDRVANLIRRQAEAFRPDTVNLLMSHIYVLGGLESDSERPIQVGGAYTVDTSALDVGAHYTALGHLHRSQNVKANSPIRYCGSPLAYSFSEAGQAKSVTVFEAIPGQPVQPEEIFLSSGKPLVKWKAREGVAEVYRWLEEGKDERAWIDLEIHLTSAMSMEDIQKLRKAREGLIHIRPFYTTESQPDILKKSESLPIDEMFRRFYARQTGGAVPEPELIHLFMELLNESAEIAEE